MDKLEALFIESLGLEYLFCLGEVDRQELNKKTSSITFTIEIDKLYRPSRFHTKHSSYEKCWQHLSLFQSPCYIKADLPVFMDSRTGKTAVIEVPKARKGSGFTLLFEQEV